MRGRSIHRVLTLASLALAGLFLTGCTGRTAIPSGPAPAKEATNVNYDVSLTWAQTKGATSYDVYFGTQKEPPKVAEGLTMAKDQDRRRQA